MKLLSFRTSWCVAWLLAGATAFCLAITSPAVGQENGAGPESADRAGGESRPDSPRRGSRVGEAVAQAQSDARLRFNFRGTSWSEVLSWFADEADLSLQIDQTPQGTVNFVDPERTYTVSEGLDLLNRLLLSRGWALVRDGRMLRIIDLEAENASKLIRETAELVTPQQFDERGESDIVTCIFPLGGIDPEDAREELAEMVGPWGDIVVLDSARQVKVTETVAKLRAIQEVLESATRTAASVVTIPLQHRTAEELLEIARPLLGLEPGENSGENIRISVSLYGDRIFATGLPAELALLEQIIEQADTPLPAAEAGEGAEMALPVLVTHPVTTADINTAFDVLQTMLAGVPDARIAIEPKTNSVVASARPETQELIRKTIAELEGRGTSFEVIDLKRLEPSQALLTINKFFGVTEEGGDGPIVDGDPVTGRLWVRGTPEQIDTVKRLLAELEGKDDKGLLGDRVRVLPYTGPSAQEAINRLESLWRMTGRENQIRVVTPSRGAQATGGIRERRIGGRNGGSGEAKSATPTPPAGPPEARVESELEQVWVSGPPAPPAESQPSAPSADQAATVPSPSDRSPFPDDEPAGEAGQTQPEVAGADIVVQMTPAGLVIASEDPEALDTLQALLETVSDPGSAPSDLPTIYWLKYIEADVAAEMVSSVLGGAESSAGSLADSVVGSLGGGMLGGLLGMGGGGNESSARSVLTTTGSVNIVPDARLNALIVQANPVDLQFIDMILEKIDVQESPEDVETVAKPALIPVIYQDAKDVAELVKAIYADRIAGQGDNNDRGGGRGGGGMPSPQEFFAALRGGGRGGRGGGGNNSPQSEPAKISVEVDARSNSLVVTATPQDFLEIRQLVETLDQQGMESEEGIAVVAIPGAVKADVVQQALESVLGREVESTSGGSSSSGRASGSDNDDRPGGGASPEDIRRRIEFFRSRFGGGRGGGSPFGGGGGFGGRGGTPGGGGRF